MVSHISSLLLLLVLGSTLHSGHAQLSPGSQCRTPDGNAGTCVILRECGPLWSILLELRRDIENKQFIDYLRQSQCGFVGDSPVVCCPSEDIPKGVSETGSQAIENHPKLSLLPTECGHSITDYIVGGNEAQLGEYPWLAGLEYKGRHGTGVYCGGALISKRYVLTAAHCIVTESYLQLVSVRLGEHDLKTDPDCKTSRTGTLCAPLLQRIQVERVIPHPQYHKDNVNRHFDIGLIRLRQDVQLSDYVQPVCLPTSAQLKERGNPAAIATLRKVLSGKLAGLQQTVAGWGKTENGTGSNVKLRVTLPVMENARCTMLYNGRVNLDATQMCAGGQKGKDSCNGDSGGPLMTNQVGKWLVTGLVSAGIADCGTLDKPGVYTRVSPFLPWLLDNLRP